MEIGAAELVAAFVAAACAGAACALGGAALGLVVGFRVGRGKEPLPSPPPRYAKRIRSQTTME
jgi:hypothetical protein